MKSTKLAINKIKLGFCTKTREIKEKRGKPRNKETPAIHLKEVVCRLERGRSKEESNFTSHPGL